MVATVETQEPTGSRAALRRWFKLTGVFPIGVFLALHLWTGAALLTSREAYDKQLAAMNGIPFVGALEVVLVFLPLAFHSLFGLHLAFRADKTPHHYASDRLHLAQRASGLVAFVFVAWHFWSLRAQAWLSGLGASTYSTRLESQLSSTVAGVPWAALGYAIGLAACVFHLANGMTSFWASRGLARGVEARRRASIVFATLGGLFFLVSFAVVVQLATGTRLLPATEAGKTGACGPSAAPAPSALPGPGQ